MSCGKGELPIPGYAMTDSGSIEVIRVWIANKGLHCSLRIGAWAHDPEIDERKAWGVVLADTIQHVADGLQRPGKDKTQTVAVILTTLLAELDRPTSATAGDFVDEPSRN
jgi:hypothetical protein